MCNRIFLWAGMFVIIIMLSGSAQSLFLPDIGASVNNIGVIRQEGNFKYPWERDLLISNGTYYFESFGEWDRYENVTIINATVFIKKYGSSDFNTLKIINSTLVVEERANKSDILGHELYLNKLYVINSYISRLIAYVDGKITKIIGSTFTFCDLHVVCDYIRIQNTTLSVSEILCGPHYCNIVNCTFKDVGLSMVLAIVNESDMSPPAYGSFHLYFVNNTITFTDERNNSKNKEIRMFIFLRYEESFKKAYICIENNIMHARKNNFIKIYVSGTFWFNFKNKGKKIPWSWENLTDCSFKNNTNMEFGIYYDVYVNIKDANTLQPLTNVSIEIIPLNKSPHQHVEFRYYMSVSRLKYRILTYCINRNDTLIHYKMYKVVVKKDGYYPSVAYLNMPNDIYKVILMYGIITWEYYITYVVLIAVIVIVILYALIRRKLKTKT